MNIPASITGFTTAAPDFPEIVGLPLYPFAEAMFAAFLERYTIRLTGLPNWSYYPFPATGRGFCSNASHTHEHFLILQAFDDELSALCTYYFNQYTLNQPYPNDWTFDTLLAKALELLGLSSDDGISKLSSSNYGIPLAAWAVQRAVMLSLLKCLSQRSVEFGRAHGKYMAGWTSDTPPRPTSGEAAYNQAAQRSTEQTYIQSSYVLYHNTIELSRSNEYWNADIEQQTQIAFVPREGYEWILSCPAVQHITVRPADTFYDFGTGFTEGLNVTPVSFDENGVFFRQSFPYPPPSYGNSAYGFSAQGQLYFDVSSHFQYNMTWDES